MASVLTLADLDRWSFEGTALAVLGFPIKHSISPAMHTAALSEMAQSDERFSKWTYVRFEVPPEHLGEALRRLHAKSFYGLNLTVPHKVLACALVEEIDPAARPIGAVNTLRRTARGWQGFNTDGYGLAKAVQETLGLSLTDRPIVLLGAGGAARGAAVECLQRGCQSLWIGNRTRENLDRLLSDLTPLAKNTVLRGFDPTQPDLPCPPNALIINATSAGLKSDDPPPVDLSKLDRPAGVYDMIYNPPVTPLLAAARALGIPTANGLSMLVHQGVRALEIWSEASVPVLAMQTAAQDAMRLR
ncbi:MAG TPA: shikimate dehydrogenase [Opitutaceae bacterium]|nr:shikimate dehydrogenase [Opitutaceae bacterium]